MLIVKALNYCPFINPFQLLIEILNIFNTYCGASLTILLRSKLNFNETQAAVYSVSYIEDGYRMIGKEKMELLNLITEEGEYRLNQKKQITDDWYPAKRYDFVFYDLVTKHKKELEGFNIYHLKLYREIGKGGFPEADPRCTTLQEFFLGQTLSSIIDPLPTNVGE